MCAQICRRSAVPAISLTLLCVGCIAHRYDICPPTQSGPITSLSPTCEPQPINVHVDLRLFELPLTFSDEIASRRITEQLISTGLFVEADEANACKAGDLHVVVYPHLFGPFAEGFVKLYVTTLTLGLVSTHHDQYYDAIVTYTPPNGPPVTWSYRYPVTHTNGIDAMSVNENTVSMSLVIPRVLSNASVDFVHSFQSTAYGATAEKKLDRLQSTPSENVDPIWVETNCNFLDSPEFAMDIVPELDCAPAATILR